MTDKEIEDMQAQNKRLKVWIWAAFFIGLSM